MMEICRIGSITLILVPLILLFVGVCPWPQVALLGCKEAALPEEPTLLREQAQSIVECAARSRRHPQARSFVWSAEGNNCDLYGITVYREWEIVTRDGATFCLLLDCSSNVFHSASYGDYDSCLPFKYSSGVYAETYLNVGNSWEISGLKLQEKYQNKQPDYTYVFKSFMTPWTSLYDDVAYELTALFKPPKTGFYTFGANCDNGCEVLLSTNEEENNFRIIIASQLGHGYNLSPLQSQRILLIANNYYLLRGTVKESYGGDYIRVGVGDPDGKYTLAITEDKLCYSSRWVRKT